jgi:hypothetical protein
MNMNRVKEMLNIAMGKQMLQDLNNGKFDHVPNDAAVMREAANRLIEGKNMTGLQKSVRMAYYWDPATKNSNPDYNPNLK